MLKPTRISWQRITKLILCPLRNWPNWRASLTTQWIIGQNEKLLFANEWAGGGFMIEKLVWQELSLSVTGKAAVTRLMRFWMKFIDKSFEPMHTKLDFILAN